MTGTKAAAIALTSGILLTLAVAGPASSYLEATRAPRYVILDNHRHLAEAVWEQAYSPILADSLAPKGDPPDIHSCDFDLIQAAEKSAGMALEVVEPTVQARNRIEADAIERTISSSSPLLDLS